MTSTSVPSPSLALPVGVASRARTLASVFLALAAVTWVQIAFGALVRAKQAGLACPDWPLCHGEVVPNLKLDGVIYEYGHRVFALVVSALYGIGAIGLWRAPDLRARMGRLAVGGGVLLLVQIVFGGLTVLIVHHEPGAAPRPAAWTVSTHLILGNGFATLGLLAGLELRRLAARLEPVAGAAAGLTTGVRLWLWGWTASLLTQFVLGGMVAANIAGLVCTEFPACNGGVWFPSFTGYVGLQIFHRLNAYLLVVLGLGLMLAVRRVPRLSQAGRVIAGLLACQVAVGIVNVFSYLHPVVTVAHSTLAALLFSATGWVWYQAIRER